MHEFDLIRIGAVKKLIMLGIRLNSNSNFLGRPELDSTLGPACLEYKVKLERANLEFFFFFTQIGTINICFPDLNLSFSLNYNTLERRVHAMVGLWHLGPLIVVACCPLRI